MQFLQFCGCKASAYSPKYRSQIVPTMSTLMEETKIHPSHKSVKIIQERGAWVTQSVEHATFGPGVVSSSPAMGIELT